jgi:hypothetical protein
MTGAIGMAAALALVVFFGLGGGLFVLRWLRLARPLDEAVLAKAGHDSSVRPTMGVRIDLPMANAIAFPWTGCVAVTERAMSVLNEEELVCVLRHEIAHLNESIRTKVRRLAPLALLFALATQRWIGAAFGRGTAYAILGSFLALTLIGRRNARRAEERADRHAIADGSAAVYARTLERIYRANLAPATTRRWAVHPSLYDRMVAAGVQPDFPRPSAPAHVGFVSAILLATVVGIVYGFIRLDAEVVERPGRHEAEMLRALAFGRIPDYHIADLAHARYNDGRIDDAAFFYRAAAEIAPKNAAHEAHLAIALARDSKCEEAAVVLAEAKRRTQGSTPEAYVQSALSVAEQAVAYCRSQSKTARGDTSRPAQTGRKE